MKRLTDYGRRRGAELGAVVAAENKECFRNAAMAVLLCEPGVDELRYVEGYATAYGIPMYHAWLEGPRGAVIEVTPTWRSERGHADTVYFPGVRLSREEVAGEIEAENLPLGGGLFIPTELVPAYRESFTYAFGVDPEEARRSLAGLAEVHTPDGEIDR